MTTIGTALCRTVLQTNRALLKIDNLEWSKRKQIKKKKKNNDLRVL